MANQDPHKGGHSQKLIWVRPTSKHPVTESLLVYDPYQTQLVMNSSLTHIAKRRLDATTRIYGSWPHTM